MGKRFEVVAKQHGLNGKQIADVILSFNVFDDRTYLNIEKLSGEGQTKRYAFDTIKLIDNIEEFLREQG